MSQKSFGISTEATPIEQANQQLNSRLRVFIRQFLLPTTLSVMFLIALIIRASHFENSRHVAEVQYRSAMIARSIYFRLVDDIPEWRRDANSNSLQNLTIKNLLVREPPLTEFIAAAGYWLIGREDLRIPRLLITLYWLVGGFFLFKIAQRWTSCSAAIVATSFYLFVPIAVIISISFQVDSLMIMMFLISIHAILNYSDEQTWKKLVLAALWTGLAFLVRPLILFALSGAFLGLAIYQAKGFRSLFEKKLFVFFIISYAPLIFYYGYQILITGNLMEQAEVSFLPQLWLTKGYWLDWLQTSTSTIGLTPILAAAIGIPLAHRRAFRAILIGLWLGYIIFCLFFTYHIRFAGYYHLQLIPIVALSFAPLVSIFIEYIRRVNNRWYWSFFYFAAVFLLFLTNYRQTNNLIHTSTPIENMEIAQEIGEIVNHSSRTVYIASYYGWPLEYYAELTGTYWPRMISDTDLALGRDLVLSITDRMDQLWFVPEYFVITSMREFYTYHNDLKEYLEGNCQLVKEREQYLIYGSCSQ
jgi:4-amino-4-deoxy-L-arabinose transferase-like glycosyltransferase